MRIKKRPSKLSQDNYILNKRKKIENEIQELSKKYKSDQLSYKDILPDIERIGTELDDLHEPASGGIAIEHTGPFNNLGSSSGPTDKAAQLHDIGYGILGKEAYLKNNPADDKYLNDLSGQYNPLALVGKAAFNLKKAVAPNLTPDRYTRKLRPKTPKKYSIGSRIPSFLTTPSKKKITGLTKLASDKLKTPLLKMDVDTAAPVISNALGQTGLPNTRTIVHQANNDIPVSTQTIKISNTYKVFLSNNDDISISNNTTYRHWGQEISGRSIIDYKKNVEFHPIYSYNRARNPGAGVDGSSIYVKLPWKLLPTLKNENYLTPSDWDNILRMGYTKMKVLNRKVKLGGLYQLHNYTTTTSGEVQVQGNPFIEICQPKGQFFKHEHYPLLRTFDPLVTVDPTNTKGIVDVTVMNAVKGFVSGDPRDCEALGFNKNSILDLDPLVTDQPFNGSENNLQNYYYPTYIGNVYTNSIDAVTDAKNEWAQWYPDISRTQDVMLTDNLDGIEFDVPCDTTAINMSDYVLWARPGQKMYQASIPTSPSSTEAKFVCDYSTCAIGRTTYNKSMSTENDFISYQTSMFEDWSPVLIRAPNHYNTGNSQIVNNCYFYVTYESEIEVSQHHFNPSLSYYRPMRWDPITTRNLSYNKLFGKLPAPATDSVAADGAMIIDNRAKSYQSNLRYTHNYGNSSLADNPPNLNYQSFIINDTIEDITAGHIPMRNITPTIINSTQADKTTVFKLQSEGQRTLQD